MVTAPLNRMTTFMGTYFEYSVPNDTFFDERDGFTRNLTLRLLRSTGDVVSASYWAQIDVDQQLIYGLAVSAGVDRFTPAVFVDNLTLQAVNSRNQSATTNVDFSIDTSPLVNVSHQFVLEIDLPIDDVSKDIDVLIAIVKKIGEYFSADKPSDVTVMAVENKLNSSIGVWWTNNTVSKAVCDNATVLSLYTRMAVDGRLDSLQSSLSPFNVLSVAMEWAGVCLLTDHHTPSSVSKSDSDGDDGIAVWLFAVVILAIAIVAISCIVALTVCVCDQRRHNSARYSVKARDAPVVPVSRKPMILENELEMQSSPAPPPRRARKPVVLEQDCDVTAAVAYRNQAFEDDSAAKRPPDYNDELNGSCVAETPTSARGLGTSHQVEETIGARALASREPHTRRRDDELSRGVAASNQRWLPAYDFMDDRSTRPPPAYRLPPPYVERET